MSKAKKRAKRATKQPQKQKRPVEKQAKPSLSLPKFNRFKELIIVFTLLALYLRILNLEGLTLWVDEYVHVLGVRDFLDGKGSLMPYDRNGFLYNVLILPLFAIFGDGAFVARLPSAIVGGLSVYMLYVLCKEIFTKEIAIYAAFLTAISIYLIFWSRVARNYSLFLLTYLALIWAFYKALNPPKEVLKIGTIWDKYKVDPKFLGLTGIALILAYFSHKLVLFFFFSSVFYFLFMAIDKTISQRKIDFKHSFTLLAIPSLLFLIFFFTPTLTATLRPILATFIPDSMIDWVLPDWTEINRLWQEEQYKVWTVYENIMTYEYPYLYLLAIPGLVFSFFINRKAGYFLLSFFLVPLLLMSFVLRGVYNPRYLVFLYPFFLVSLATTMFFVFHWLPNKFFNKAYDNKLYNFSLFLPFIIFIGFGTIEPLKDFITLKKKNGYVINKKLSTWSFSNWKDVTDYLKKNMKNGDVVMTTLPNATNYYMGWSEGGSIQFRQKYLDITTSKYVNYERESNNLDAHTVENVERTIKEHQRGWLLADYYFETIYTDPVAKRVVYKNMDFVMNASPTGDVKVFSWDLTKKRVFPTQDMLELVGRNPSRMASETLNFNIPEEYMAKESVVFNIAIQGNNSNREAFLVLNKKLKYYIPPNKTNGIEIVKLTVQTKSLNGNGANAVQFGYEKSAREKDPNKGFAVHGVTVF